MKKLVVVVLALLVLVPAVQAAAGSYGISERGEA